VVRLGSDNEYTEDLAPALFYSGDLFPKSTITQYKITLKIQQNSLNSLSCDFSYQGGPPEKCSYTMSQSWLQPCRPPQSKPETIEMGSLVTICVNLIEVRSEYVTVHLEGNYNNSDYKLVANYRFYPLPNFQGISDCLTSWTESEHD
jgi:hypothetical protein